MDNFKKPKTWAEIEADPRVAEAWIDSDGRWVALKPGYWFWGEVTCTSGTTATLREDMTTIGEVKKD